MSIASATLVATVLIIEDEAGIRKHLRAILNGHGLASIEARTAQEGLQKLTLNQPDLILLDLGLPDKDGQDMIRDLREWTQLPIIVVSARDRETDKIQALEAGADDYLTKPFAAGELLARVKVALRHAQRALGNGSSIYENSGLSVDFGARRVTLDGQGLHLTPIEYKLLSTLTRNAGKVLTHAQLGKALWGRHVERNDYLRIHTQHLREKLRDDPLSPRFIFTEPGIGYRFG